MTGFQVLALQLRLRPRLQLKLELELELEVGCASSMKMSLRMSDERLGDSFAVLPLLGGLPFEKAWENAENTKNNN